MRHAIVVAVAAGLGIAASCSPTPVGGVTDSGTREACYLRGRYVQATSVSERTYDLLASRMFATRQAYDHGLRSNSLYTRGNGRVSVELQGRCDSARPRLEAYVELLATSANDEAVASELRMLPKSWAEIDLKQYENLNPDA